MLVCILLLLLRPFSLYEPVLRRMEIENHYTHTCILYYFFSVIKNKGDCYVSLKASELKCMFVFVCMSERKRWIYVWRAYSHNFMQCKSYSKSITASDSKKPLCFPCCMLQYKTNLFYLLLTVAYLWTTELTQVPFNL